MTTAYITHTDCLRHEMGAGHPENPERLNAVNEHMKSSGLLAELRSLGCDLGQGFYFARPQPSEIAAALVHHRLRWRSSNEIEEVA